MPPTEHDHQFWMQQALLLAQEARDHNEVPVGAIVVLGDVVIGRGYNQPITSCDPTAHAEMVALREAARTLDNYRLVHSRLYVTLEPCAMCAGAMVHARVGELIIGAADPKTGAAGSIMNVVNCAQLNHRIPTQMGVMADQSSQLLREFFLQRR